MANATEKSLLSRFVGLTFWNILSNITVPLAGLVDTAMLGHLDDLRYLSGVALGAVLFTYVYWTFGFLRMGATGQTAQAVGRRDRVEQYAILYRFLALAFGIALVILLVQVPVAELGFWLLSGEEAVKQAGRDYYFARIQGAPAAFGSMVLLGWFLGREQSRVVLAMTLVANVVNIGLNYLFILRWGWAAAGAGYATAISQYAMLAVGVVFLLAQGSPVRVASAELWNRDRVQGVLRLNFDIMIRTFSLVTAFALMTGYSAVLGGLTLAANAVLLRLLETAAYLIDGAAFAAESLGGIFRGERDLAALRRLERTALLAGLGFAMLFFLPLWIAPGWFFSWMTNSPELLATLDRYYLWLVPALLLGSAAFIYDGIFLGLTESSILRNAMIVSLLLGFLPVAYPGLLARDNDWLWVAMSTFMFTRAATLAVGMWYLRRRFAREWAT